MIRDSGAAVCDINAPAFLKSVCFQKVLHRSIAGMCIRADICCPCFTKRQAAAEHAFFSAARGNAVDCAVRLVI